MELVKSYCGLMLMRSKFEYYCIDIATRQVKASGTRKEMENYFREHAKEV